MTQFGFHMTTPQLKKYCSPQRRRGGLLLPQTLTSQTAYFLPQTLADSHRQRPFSFFRPCRPKEKPAVYSCFPRLPDCLRTSAVKHLLFSLLPQTLADSHRQRPFSFFRPRRPKENLPVHFELFCLPERLRLKTRNGRECLSFLAHCL